MTTDELVDEIFGRTLERIERGEVVQIEDLLRAHPDLAEALRERFAMARLLDRAGASGPARRRDDQAALPIGTTLGPYRIESVLGVGGMGTVYRASVGCASDGMEAGCHVAVKVFHPHLVTRERFTARFLREAELGRRVRHPNVVRTMSAGEVVEAGRTVRFLVMERVAGRTLREMLGELGRLPEELCRHVGREVSRGLAAIHAAGAVHRDLKPENVIVTDDHVVKVMDLGVAHVDEVGTLSESGVFIGSLRYGAPEQFARSSDVDGRADLHALGLLLYELATGVHPFAGTEIREVVRQVLDSQPRRCGELAPQVSAFLEELVAQLLEKDRAKRPAGAGAVAAILEEGEASAWWKERAAAIRRETRRPLRRIRIPRETALYGRDTEIARLRSLFDKAKSGDGQVVLVEGEAGIGKSRLVDEFVGQLARAGEDVNFLFGSYPPGGAATTAGAFSVAYREHLGDDEAAVRAALPQAPSLVPAFAALLRGDVAPADAQKLTKDSLQTVFVYATRSLAAERPTIVLIEDLHFAPEEGRSLFASLALAVRGHRVLLVSCARPGLDEKWVTQIASWPHTTRLSIPRLGAKELVHLLRDALKSERLAEELGGLIAVKSDGNPFFVFELLRGLRDGQFLRQRQDGTWETTQVIRDIQVPSSIVELVQARVADLDGDDKNLLDVASCCGFEFDPLVVAGALGVPRITAMQRLARIEKRQRLVHSTGRRFVFDHHQVQEALYAGMPELLREGYHAMIGEALESTYAALGKDPKDLDGTLCVQVAEHYFKGARGARGLRYLDAALVHLEKGYRNDAAIRLAERSLAVAGLVAGRERVKLLLRVAAINGPLDNLGRREEQRRYIEEALALARESGDRRGEIDSRAYLGWTFSSLCRFAEAQEQFEGQLSLSREIGDRKSEANATGSLGGVYWALGRLADAREQLERHLAMAREIGDRLGEANATGNLGGVFWLLGRLPEARERFERHLAMAREIGDRRGEAKVTGNLGGALWSLGRFAEAREYFERALAFSREFGDRVEEVRTTGNLGQVFVSLGRFSEAQELHERQLALAREIGDRRAEARAAGNLGLVYALLGRLAPAREHLERQLGLSRKFGERREEGIALRSLALLAAETEDVALAEQHFAAALELRRSLGTSNAEAESLGDRGAFRARKGRIDEARADLVAAIALARKFPLPSIELLATSALATLPGGDVATALAAFAAHEGRAETQALMNARLLLWRATRDAAHLREAKRRLDSLVEHAPPECHEPMLTNVRVNREIVAAWRAEFGDVPTPRES